MTMKKQLLAFVFIALSGMAIAQAKRYTISPSRVLIQKADLGVQNDYKIYMDNLTNDVLSIKWQLVSKDLVKGWDYSMCAFGICYTGIPDTLCTMNPIGGYESGFLSLLIDPGTVEGTGRATYYVYDSQNPAIKDTVSFIITAGTNGIRTDKLANAWSVYPNPASETVSIKIEQNGVPGSSIRIMDVIGQTVYEASGNAGLNLIPVHSLSAGIYYVRYDSGDGNCSAKKLEIIR